MASRNEWEQYFDAHAPLYMENCFVGNTVEEVGFVAEQLDLQPGSSILDVGCGTGRHAVEFARRGFRVTGVDISAGMLAQARTAAEQAGVNVKWIQSDAALALPEGPFDHAVCLCEGAFGLLGGGEDPYEHEAAILGNINRALRSGGGVILTATNGMAQIRRVSDGDVQAGRFDPDTMVEVNDLPYETPAGGRTATVRERGFVPSELVLLFRHAGFDVEHLWGGTAGKWARRKVELDEMEIMVVARRRAEAA
jgi:SAM-dependent methyltransferase